jgi:hypothetical protein
MKLIHNNYLRSSGAGNTWQVEIDPPTRQVGTYYEEAVIAAEMIWAEKQGSVYVCYSGGLDSEFVLSVFLSMGMNITPVIMQTQYNHQETQFAYKLCDERNLNPVVIPVDYEKFVESGKFLEIATQIQSAAHQMPLNMWLTSQLDGTVLTGNDPPHMKKHNDQWYLDEEEVIHTQLTYFEKNKIHGTPFFLTYTSELMTAFLLDPTMKRLANNEILGKTGTNSSKVHVFNNNNKFKLVQRPKLTGYESVVNAPIFTHPDITLVESWKNKWWGTSDHLYSDFISKMQSGTTSIAKAVTLT